MLIPQNNFTGGELSTAIASRVDIAKYYSGLAKLKNGFIEIQGSISSRAGLKYCMKIPTNGNILLKDFQFSVDQSYSLIFYDKKMRVSRRGRLLLNAPIDIKSITQADACVITTSKNHGLKNGDWIYMQSGIDEIDFRYYEVANITVNTLTFKNTITGHAVSGAGLTYTSAGTIKSIYEIAIPYADDDLDTLNFAQKADIITITHPKYSAKNLKRKGKNDWVIEDIVFKPNIDAPTLPKKYVGTGYKITAIDEETGDESNATKAGSSGWKAVKGAIRYNVYRFQNSMYGWVGETETTSFSDDTKAIKPDYKSPPPIERTPFKDDNNPISVTYGDDRLIFGGSVQEPSNIYGTRINSNTNFNYSNPIAEDDSFNLTIQSDKVQYIMHVLKQRNLVVFTSDSVWQVKSSDNKPISIKDAKRSRDFFVGSSHLAPIGFDRDILFVERGQKDIMSVSYSYEIDGIDGESLTILANHLFKDRKIVSWCYAKVPFNLLICVMDDGMSLILTYNVKQKIWAWSRHETDGTFKKVVSVIEDDVDAVYFVIERTIHGIKHNFLERMDNRDFKHLWQTSSVDSSISYETWINSEVDLVGDTFRTNDDVTVVSSVNIFKSADIGKVFKLRYISGDKTHYEKIRITSVTNANTASGNPVTAFTDELKSVVFQAISRTFRTVSRLEHLENKTVSVLVDGFIHPSVKVKNGSIDLNDDAGKVVIGLPFEFEVNTLPVNLKEANIQGRIKRIVSVFIDVLNHQGGLYVGVVGGEEYHHRINDKNLENYYIDINIGSNWDYKTKLSIKTKKPYPVTISSITPNVSIENEPEE